MQFRTVPISHIEVRERTRTTLTNIESLAKSIRERGLLQPVVVRRDGSDYVLVAGARRLAALASLGRTETDANVVANLDDEMDALLAEGEENTQREPFTGTEASAHADRIEALEAVQAECRRAEASKRAAARSAAVRATPPNDAQSALFVEPAAPTPAPEPSVKFTEGSGRREQPSARERAAGETRNRVAKAVGMSAPTLAKARHIVKTAQDPTVPETVREEARIAQRQMDESGQVHGAFKRVEVAEQQAALAEVRKQHAEGAAGVDARLAADLELKRKALRVEFIKALPRLDRLTTFKPDEIAELLDEDCMTALRSLRRHVDDYHDRVEQYRPKGLRLINGG